MLMFAIAADGGALASLVLAWSAMSTIADHGVRSCAKMRSNDIFHQKHKAEQSKSYEHQEIGWLDLLANFWHSTARRGVA